MLVKVLTAVLSMATAIALWPLIPRALALPTVHQLQTLVSSLKTEVGRRKSVEQQVQALEQSIALTLASIDAGFIATDLEGRVTQMNQVAEQLLGHALADAQGASLWRVFDRVERARDDAASHPVEVMESPAASGALARQVLVRARSGTVLPLQLHVAVNRDETEPAPGLILVFRDMTRANLADSDNRRLAAVVASSRDAIITKTLDGRITSWNQAATQMFGYSEAEALGVPVQTLIAPDRMDEEMRILADLAHGNTVPAFDTVRLTHDGSSLEVSVTISPLRDATGRIVGGSKIARDITARRRVEAALLDSERSRLRADRLEAANQQILQASRMKSQFLANMSHELRTPLNAIIGFAELLQLDSSPIDARRRQDYLGHIATSGHHLLRLINDVLDLAKIEAGKLDFRPAPLDLAQVLGEVCDVLQPELMRKQLRLESTIDDSIGPLVLDAVRLKQLLYNYLSNAIKFTPEGGRIAVRALADGNDHFRVEVEDDGPGITPEDLSRLFVEFQQLEAGHGKHHAGTGLGLALTRRLMQAQGGRVGVHSTPGVGSVFHFMLPRQPVGKAVDDTPDGHRVLVIEADGPHRATLVQAVDRSGYRAVDAQTAAQARQRAGQQGYHALTLGLRLPDEQGLQLLAHIRSGGPNRDTPVVGMTMPAAGGALAAFGVADVLFKPLRSGEMARAMARLSRPADRPARVLVIDDDPLACTLMADTLSALGIDTVCFEDGRVALSALGRVQPDAMVLDLMMPAYDGFAVLDALQASPLWRDLPVYVWTSMILTEDEVLRLAQSAQAIVGKGGGALGALLDSLRRARKADV